jgi:hypothetical protein
MKTIRKTTITLVKLKIWTYEVSIIDPFCPLILLIFSSVFWIKIGIFDSKVVSASIIASRTTSTTKCSPPILEKKFKINELKRII